MRNGSNARDMNTDFGAYMNLREAETDDYKVVNHSVMTNYFVLTN